MNKSAGDQDERFITNALFAYLLAAISHPFSPLPTTRMAGDLARLDFRDKSHAIQRNFTRRLFVSGTNFLSSRRKKQPVKTPGSKMNHHLGELQRTQKGAAVCGTVNPPAGKDGFSMRTNRVPFLSVWPALPPSRAGSRTAPRGHCSATLPQNLAYAQRVAKLLAGKAVVPRRKPRSIAWQGNTAPNVLHLHERKLVL